MQQAQLLVEQMPDSALMLLDSVNTALLSDAKRAEYALLRVQVKDNARMDISADTEILRAREYFIRGKNREKAALACFYAAKVVKGKDQADEQMGFYQEALEHVQHTGNKLLQGKILYNIGNLNYNRDWYAEAINRYQQALKVFQSIDGQYQREINAMNAMANSFW